MLIQSNLRFVLIGLIWLACCESFRWISFDKSLLKIKSNSPVLTHKSKLFMSHHSTSTSPVSLASNTTLPELQDFQTRKSYENLTIGFSQLQPFLKIAIPFFKDDEIAKKSLIAVGALTLLNAGISVAFSYISRDFYNALNIRDEGLFYEKIELFFAALIVAVPTTVFYRFSRAKLSIYWREALTAKVLDKYYSNRTFYIMEILKDVDNPDQRISADINSFTKSSLEFFITIFTAIIDLFSFSAILFQIYPGLFVGIVLYAGIGSIITSKLGRSLVALNYEKLENEANFRFSLFRTRENAEAIAFYDSDAKLEQKNIWGLFQEALETQLGIVLVERNLEYFTTSYRYIVQILPSLIVAPLYFSHQVELGAVSQSYGAFNHILGDFSIIINQFESLSAFSAGLTRLATFIDRIDLNQGWDIVPFEKLVESSLEQDGLKDIVNKKPLIEMRLSSEMNWKESPLDDKAPILLCQNLTILTPDASRTIVGADASSGLFDGINVSLFRGNRVLIVGASGSGKSSLVRAIAGLWQVGTGSVNWSKSVLSVQNDKNNDIMSETLRSSDENKIIPCAPKEIFFLPQKPYNLLSSLKEQIKYPNVRKTIRDDQKSIAVSGAVAGNDIYTKNGINRDRGKSLDSESVILDDGEDAEDDSYFLDILNKVRLGGLAARMGGGVGRESVGLRKCQDWSKVLSLGEQQRLAFARILYNRPSVIVLDEATSALDLSTEEAMYGLLEAMNATYVSVGHRPTLLRYHNLKLILNGIGKQPTVVPITDRDHPNDEIIDLTAVTVNQSKPSMQ
eukprot:gene14535-19517_t